MLDYLWAEQILLARKQRLFKRLANKILEFENSGNLWMLEAEIRQEMVRND